MKTHPVTRCSRNLLAMALSLATAQAFAADPYASGSGSMLEEHATVSWRDSGWVEFGPSMMDSVSATLTTYAGTNGVANYAGDLSFKTGFAAMGGFREEVSPWFAGELSGGLLYNELDSLGGAWSPDATLMQVPLMFNLVVQVPKFGPLVPFAGIGLGGCLSWLDVDDRLPTTGGGTVSVDESGTEITFAYQGFAGLKYEFGHAAVSLTYRATGTGQPRWTMRDSATGDELGKLNPDHLLVHAINVGFHVAF